MRVTANISAIPRLCLLAVAVQSAVVAQVVAEENPDASIERIVVSGEKTSRSLLETASSVGVTTSVRIEQEQLFEFSDVIQRTANVSSLYGKSGFTIRGINNNAGAANPLATIYLDGAAVPSQISGNGPLDLWDISQVEVFRGPQSTLQGENALAGAVILTSTEPTADFSARARLSVANPKDQRYAFAVGGALTTDESLLGRLSAEKRSYDGFIDNVTRNAPEDPQDNTSIRLKLLWQPLGLPDFSARLSHLEGERDGVVSWSFALRPQPGQAEFTNLSNRPNQGVMDSRFTTLDLRLALSEHWQLNSVTARSDHHGNSEFDADLSAEDTSYGTRVEEYDNWSQEFRLHYQHGAWRLINGIYLSGRQNLNNNNTLGMVPTPLPAIAALLQDAGLDAQTAMMIAGLYGQALPEVPVAYHSIAPAESRNRALFSDLEYNLNEQWVLLAGFRLDKEQYQFASVTSSKLRGALPNPMDFGQAGSLLNLAIAGINQGVTGMVAQAANEIPASERDFHAFLPKLGIRYQMDATQSVALTLQKGYRSGGTSYNTARAQVFAFEPEFTDNAELAWRWQPVEQPLSLSANLYYIDWQDKQVSANFGANWFDNHTVNAARAHLYGGEIELQYQLSSSIESYLAYGYSRTQFDQYELVDGATLDDYSGKPFDNAPKNTLSAGLNWYPADGWSLNLNGNYRSSKLEYPDDPKGLPGRLLLNTRLAWQQDNWTFSVYGQNLTDKVYVEYTRTDSAYEIVGTPRVVGIAVDYQW